LGTIPSWIIVTVIIAVLFTAVAAWRNKSYAKNALNQLENE
jgi:hypothetical protein